MRAFLRRVSRVALPLALALSAAAFLSGCRLHDGPSSLSAFPSVHDDDLVAYLHSAVTGHGPAWGEQIVEDASEHCAAPLDVALARQALHLNEVIAEALRMHPSLEAAEAAWEAALEQKTQDVALHDPQFRFLNGPTIFGANSGAHLWRVQFQQRIPWFGKTPLRGEIADQEADVARQNWRLARSRLAALATDAFFDYALAERLYELVSHEHELAYAALRERGAALERAASVSHEEMTAWELDCLEFNRSHQDSLAARERAARRLNLLLKRPPHAPLPPPVVFPAAWLPLDEAALVDRALHQRPELAIAHRRVEAARAHISLAYKDFFPDVEMVGRFDTNADQFWLPDRLNIRPQLGFNLYLPTQQGRRWARVRQTEAELRRRQAEARALEGQIRQDIHEAVAEIEQTRRHLDTLHRAVAIAQRHVASLEALHVQRHVDAEALEAARKKWIKYRAEQAKAETLHDQQLAALHALVGDDGWLCSDGHGLWPPCP